MPEEEWLLGGRRWRSRLIAGTGGFRDPDTLERALLASGRLFSVDQIAFGQPDSKKAFPDVKATITVDAFMFVGSLPAVPSTTTPSAPSGTVAAGATP